jgi:Uma2 family endonuclease
MAEPAWKLPLPWEQEPEEDDDALPVFQRWFARPDGRGELVEMPLTPEIFLDPRLDDLMGEADIHSRLRGWLADLLRRHIEPDGLVLDDVKHYLVPGRPAPAPDVSVILEARPDREKYDSFSVEKEGVRPDLILEILSPKYKRIREVDEDKKVLLYQEARIPEYFYFDPPRRGNDHQFRLMGYRLDSHGQYQPVPLDAQGRLYSETTGLWFMAEGDLIRVIEARTGKRLLYSFEEETERIAEAKARREAQERAEREAQARREAEAENARLREELERLKRGSR